jgi:hypothetical protein
VSIASKINEPTLAWARQRARIELCNVLMDGTDGMRHKGERYLPKKISETQAEYDNRLKLTALDNFFQKTVIFYLGQVFKKELNYMEPIDKGVTDKAAKEAKAVYDEDWFKKFKENVDMAGANLTVFGKKIFQAGLVDGVTFVLVDYVKVRTRTEPDTGRLVYFNEESGGWEPKTLEVDERLNLGPYFIHVPASKVLDVWVDAEKGAMVVRHFRYEEFVETPADPDGITRKLVRRVTAWWPHKWERWEAPLSGTTQYEAGGGSEAASRSDEPAVMVERGPNYLGVIPLAWFMPGEARDSLTARPPLDDLAELNRVYWVAASDHDARLMNFVRSPAFVGRCLQLEDNKQVELGPGRLIISDSPEAALESVGVDSSSASHSQADLEKKREGMRDYGLQTVQSGVTATMSENVATNASSSLKGWCADFKDTLENALKFAAYYQGWPDGPPVMVNTNFKNSLDLNLLAHLSQAASEGLIKPNFYVSMLLSMAPNTDEFSVDEVQNPDFGKESDFTQSDYDNFFKSDQEK